jgi:hypothetical protein
LCAALILFCTACSTTTPPPTASLNSARDAIARAEESGARQHADAELDEAQQKLVQAERSVRGEQMVDAERLAQESMITAQLASARSEEAKALEITREMRRSVDALAEELRRQEGQK